MLRKLLKFLITCAVVIAVLCLVFPDLKESALSLLNDDKIENTISSEQSDDSVVPFLKSVFPNKEIVDVHYEDCITKRFSDYSVQFDYNPIYLTQDAWCYVLPEPKFEKIEDCYKVTWHCTENEDQTNVVKIVKENGEWKIDNVGSIGEDGKVHLEIDYGKQPIFAYDLAEYPEELKAKLNDLYGKLPKSIPSLDDLKSNEKVNSVVDKIKGFVKGLKEGE